MSCWVMAVGSMWDPSSEVSATGKPERASTLMDGDPVTEIAGTRSPSGVVTGSARGD